MPTSMDSEWCTWFYLSNSRTEHTDILTSYNKIFQKYQKIQKQVSKCQAINVYNIFNWLI